MEGLDGSSRSKVIGAIVGAMVLAGLLAALSTAVISGFTGSAVPQDVLRRTPTPTNTTTPRPPTSTPTDTPTPTDTSTPTFTATPTFTPTPFTPKSPGELGTTVMIGGSTGSGFLSAFNTLYVPMFDGAVSSNVDAVSHLTLPGAISHLSILLDGNLPNGGSFLFTLMKNGSSTDLACTIPTKKGDYCSDDDKNSDCVDVGKQDVIAIRAIPKGVIADSNAGQVAGNSWRMSWVAKLDLFQPCSD